MKCAIVTITNGQNYGNKLQNYALQKTLEKMNLEVETLRNSGEYKNKSSLVKRKLSKIKLWLLQDASSKRVKKFNLFNEKYIKFSNLEIANKNIPNNINEKFDIFVCGSDQIWNPNYPENAKVNFLDFVHENKKKLAYAPSFGASNIPEERKEEIKKWLNKFKYISVREDDGKKIREKLTNKKDVPVLVDPTMLLTSNEWDEILEKPKQLKSNKYILNYFLGKLSNTKRDEINRIAKESNCEIINIFDKNSPFYQCGPSEFLYLEKNAFLVCTDSFHSCVFAILYNTPFVVFDRDENIVSMNSRINTLLSKFKLENRYVKDNKITEELLKSDYTESYKILEV